MVATPPQPKYMSIRAWTAFSGMSRSGTYAALAAGSLVARKVGRSTLVDVDRGVAWLNGLPEARIGKKATTQR